MALEKIVEKPSPDQAAKIEKLPVKPEKIGRPEIKTERLPVKPDKPQETVRAGEKGGEGAAPTISLAQDFQKRRAAAIDNVLAEGLNEIFLKMNAAEQKEFKKKGEETVLKINELLGKTKVKVNKIIDLIKAWLKLIPGINKFFLEQEAKIKADKIMKIKDKF